MRITGILTDEQILLDGKHFIDCTLEDCTLIYQGGTVVFERTLITKCRYVFGQQARQTIDLLQAVGLLSMDFTSREEAGETVH